MLKLRYNFNIIDLVKHMDPLATNDDSKVIVDHEINFSQDAILIIKNQIIAVAGLNLDINSLDSGAKRALDLLVDNVKEKVQEDLSNYKIENDINRFTSIRLIEQVEDEFEECKYINSINDAIDLEADKLVGQIGCIAAPWAVGAIFPSYPFLNNSQKIISQKAANKVFQDEELYYNYANIALQKLDPNCWDYFWANTFQNGTSLEPYKFSIGLWALYSSLNSLPYPMLVPATILTCISIDICLHAKEYKLDCGNITNAAMRFLSCATLSSATLALTNNPLIPILAFGALYNIDFYSARNVVNRTDYEVNNSFNSYQYAIFASIASCTFFNSVITSPLLISSVEAVSMASTFYYSKQQRLSLDDIEKAQQQR